MLFEVIVLALVAWTGTLFGGLLAFLVRDLSQRQVAFSFGFTSGVMLALSAEMMLRAWVSPAEALAGFLVGMVFLFLVDSMLPHFWKGLKETGGNHVPHVNALGLENIPESKRGALIALGMAIHNLPEGFILYPSYAWSAGLGIATAIAIALHNIPEGLVIALPLAQAKARKRTIIRVTAASGLAEPIGAILAAVFLSSTGPWLLVASTSFAAGVMTYISFDELIPAAREHGHERSVLAGLVFGGAVAALLPFLLGV